MVGRPAASAAEAKNVRVAVRLAVVAAVGDSVMACSFELVVGCVGCG